MSLSLEDNKTQVKLLFNNEPLATLHKDFFPQPKKLLSKLQDQNKEACYQSFTELLEQAALLYTYKKLGVKAYSSYALSRLLKERYLPQLLIEKILQQLENSGYIDDEGFIASTFDSMIARGCGPQKILYKLQQKGFPYERLSKATQRYYPSAEQEKQMEKLAKENTHLEKPQLYRSLIHRGFHSPQALNYLNQFFH